MLIDQKIKIAAQGSIYQCIKGRESPTLDERYRCPTHAKREEGGETGSAYILSSKAKSVAKHCCEAMLDNR